MACLLTKLGKIVSEKTSGKHKIMASESLKYHEFGKDVIVGGKVKAIIDIFENEPVQVILDDDIGEIQVEVYRKVFEEFSERFEIGNVLIIKGILRKTIRIADHPENTNKSSVYIICKAVAVVS